MRAGRVEEASAIDRRVGLLIERATKRHLKDIDPRGGLGDLWSRVGQIIKRKHTTRGVARIFGARGQTMKLAPPPASPAPPRPSLFNLFHIFQIHGMAI